MVSGHTNELTPEDVESIVNQINESEEYYVLDEALSEIRWSGEDTDLPCPSSNHYETKQVAVDTPVGWVAFTYWYGGGKHANPEDIDWLEDAYFVDMQEKEVTIIERTFTKKED